MQPRYPNAPRRQRTGSTADAVAGMLGWFSIALGVAEVLAPDALARCLGMRRDAGTVRAYGMREILTGIGLLRSRDPAPWVWGRVVGDVLDLATLGRGLDDHNPKRFNVGLAIGTVAAITIVDLLCARALHELGQGSYVSPDYSDRSGFPRPPSEMRGSATIH